MIRCTITTGKHPETGIYQYHPSAVVARSPRVARWLFSLTGWQSKNGFPDLCYPVREIAAPEVPYGDERELWVLENRLHMN